MEAGEAPIQRSELFPANGSTQGGRTDKWCAARGSTKSIQIDLGTAKPLTKLVVQHAAAGGESGAYNTRNFVLETAGADGTWSTAVTIANNTAATTTHPVNLTARKLRLTTTDAVARIYEIEAY